jgi:hypothetical protein
VRLALDAIVFYFCVGVHAPIGCFGCHAVSLIINCLNRNPSPGTQSRNWMMIFCKYFATINTCLLFWDR